MNIELITPENHPGHHTVGRDFVGGIPSGRFYCDSYDPSQGYWLTPRQPVNLDGQPLERINVSERAIGRTFHEVYIIDINDGQETTTSGWLSFLRRWRDHFNG